MATLIDQINRRIFLKIISFTGISGLMFPEQLLSRFGKSSANRLVIVEESSATNGSSINAEAVQTMVDAGIKTLTQIQDIGQAWKSLFPDIDTNKIIAIKINCRYETHTNIEVTEAVTKGLQQMDFNGFSFPANNIIVYDKHAVNLTDSGYTINTSSTGVRYFANNYYGYTSNTYAVHTSAQSMSKIISEIADYLVNISVLKNHSTAGVTVSMKNHYGTIKDPNKMHDDHADPFLPALNSLPEIAGKQMINICDALFAVVNGGPGGLPQATPNKIFMSQNTVVLDYVGRQMLADLGCETIDRAHHVDTAAGEPYNLGTNDPSQMDIVNVINPVSISKDKAMNPNQFYLKQNYPNPFNNSTQIQFYMPQTANARLEIFDTNGNMIKLLMNDKFPKGWHSVSWKINNDSGIIVASGVYICRLTCVSFQKAIIMQVVK